MNFLSIKANMEGCDLEGMNLSKTKLGGVNFRHSFLSYVNFEGAYLVGANFEGSDLTGANFKNANIKGANFKNAVLDKTNFEGTGRAHACEGSLRPCPKCRRVTYEYNLQSVYSDDVQNEEVIHECPVTF